MFKLFTASLLVSLLLVAQCAPTFPRRYSKPSNIVDKVSSSIVRLTTQTSHGEELCSGFVIAPHIVLTAHHCLGPQLLVDGQENLLLKSDAYYDLALLLVPKLEKPSLYLRDAPVTRFEELIAIGYGYGWYHLTALDETVIIVNYSIEGGAPVGIIVQSGYIQGMSGGPVSDQEGYIVGIIQRTTTKVGYGIGTQLINAFLLGEDLKNPIQTIPLPSKAK